jgi:hypothetical protein
VYFVNVLPKTRSGKLLRRALQAVAERRDPGDLTTMDDPAALQQVKDLVGFVAWVLSKNLVKNNSCKRLMDKRCGYFHIE